MLTGGIDHHKNTETIYKRSILSKRKKSKEREKRTPETKEKEKREKERITLSARRKAQKLLLQQASLCGLTVIELVSNRLKCT